MPDSTCDPVWLSRLVRDTYVARSCEPSSRDVEAHVRALAEQLGRQVSITILDRDGDPRQLEAHTEGVYRADPFPFFVLGCIAPGSSGGETVLCDARICAEIIRAEHPELVDVEIEYRSPARHARATHRLVSPTRVLNDSSDVLIFREDCYSNRILKIPAGWTQDAFYSYMTSVLDRGQVCSHRWEPGEIMVVDNRVSLHYRLPFVGRRVMVRARVEAHGGFAQLC